jgi:hypothetical protein
VADGVDARELGMQVAAGDPAVNCRSGDADLIDANAAELPPSNGGHTNFAVCVTTGLTDSPSFGHKPSVARTPATDQYV